MLAGALARQAVALQRHVVVVAQVVHAQHLALFRRREAPRDTAKLSPHSHADFEQASLLLEGDYVHHLRWPWGPDMSQWRPDEAGEVGSPSVLIIPAKVVHTSRNVGPKRSWLIDVFGPPRMDFSSKPGMVCNEADYPMPT